MLDVERRLEQSRSQMCARLRVIESMVLVVELLVVQLAVLHGELLTDGLAISFLKSVAFRAIHPCMEFYIILWFFESFDLLRYFQLQRAFSCVSN